MISRLYNPVIAQLPLELSNVNFLLYQDKHLVNICTHISLQEQLEAIILVVERWLFVLVLEINCIRGSSPVYFTTTTHALTTLRTSVRELPAGMKVPYCNFEVHL